MRSPAVGGGLVDAVAVLRLLRFRTVRPAFDAVLRTTVLPRMRGITGVRMVRAGRQGPEEVGLRVLVSVWSTPEAMESALGGDLDGHEVGTPVEITDATVDVLPILASRLDARPLGAGILRLAQGRAGGSGLAGLTELALQDVAASEERDAGPGDFVVAGAEGRSFVVVSTWPDWASIEAATGASISEPLRNKRLAELEDFHVDHLELVGGQGEGD